MTDTDKTIVLSGIRATGEMHIGNLLGAIQFFVELARKPDTLCLFFVANLHSLTTRQDPEAMMRELREIVRWWLAGGIDPTEHIIFVQSSVPETTELTWLLNCLTPVAELERLPHWKEKSQSGDMEGYLVDVIKGLLRQSTTKDFVSREEGERSEDDAIRAYANQVLDELARRRTGGGNAGLLDYPVLMAADILGPGANIVPVGEDQHPHVELARELARRFNHQVKENLFPVPELMDQAIRVPGLIGAGKMGKSEPKGTINLVDDAKTVRKKCMKAHKRLPTPDATEPRMGDEPGDPDICRVFQIQALVARDAGEELEVRDGCRAGTLRCGDCKGLMAERITRLLTPLQKAHAEVAKRGDDYIDDILADGGRRARAMIAPRVIRAKELMGVPAF